MTRLDEIGGDRIERPTAGLIFTGFEPVRRPETTPGPPHGISLPFSTSAESRKWLREW